MIIYTIYEHPKDFPEHYVVRQWKIKPNQTIPQQHHLAKSLTAAREFIPAGLVRAPGQGYESDPCIVESWF